MTRPIAFAASVARKPLMKIQTSIPKVEDMRLLDVAVIKCSLCLHLSILRPQYVDRNWDVAALGLWVKPNLMG